MHLNTMSEVGTYHLNLKACKRCKLYSPELDDCTLPPVCFETKNIFILDPDTETVSCMMHLPNSEDLEVPNA